MSDHYFLGLFGHDIGYSLSPLIHSYWFSRYGIPAQYQLYDTDPAVKTQTLNDLLYQQFHHGFNVTIPYKEFVFSQLGAKAERVKAVNTIYRLSDGKIAVANTDVSGGLDIFRGICSNNYIVILGNGGTARALVEIFFQLKVPCVHVVQRQSKPWHPDYKEMLAFHDWSEAELLIGEADILINTVPNPLLKGDNLIRKKLFCDYSYGKRGSFLRQRAEKCGCEIIPGIEFLLKQAQHSFKYWFDIYPDITPRLRSLLLS